MSECYMIGCGPPKAELWLKKNCYLSYLTNHMTCFESNPLAFVLFAHNYFIFDYY